MSVGDGYLWRPSGRCRPEHPQAQGGAPEGQGIVPVRLSVHRDVPPLALCLAPAPEVEDDGRLSARQGGGEELREKAQGLLSGARVKPGGTGSCARASTEHHRRGESVVAVHA